jgi:hypothetical protein
MYAYATTFTKLLGALHANKLMTTLPDERFRTPLPLFYAQGPGEAVPAGIAVGCDSCGRPVNAKRSSTQAVKPCGTYQALKKKTAGKTTDQLLHQGEGSPVDGGEKMPSTIETQNPMEISAAAAPNNPAATRIPTRVRLRMVSPPARGAVEKRDGCPAQSQRSITNVPP